MEDQPQQRFDIYEFLKDRSISTNELRKVVLEHLDDIIESFPEIDLDNTQILEISEGVYRCDKKPAVEFLRNPKNFLSGNIEIGIFKLHGKWLFNLSHTLENALPIYLQVLKNDGLFELDMHSHPGEDEGAEVPSFEDSTMLNNTDDGHCYIFSLKGIKDFHKPEYLPGVDNAAVAHVQKAWKCWIVNELKLTEEEFNNRGGYVLQKEFFEKFFGLKNTPWDNEENIRAILERK